MKRGLFIVTVTTPNGTFNYAYSSKARAEERAMSFALKGVMAYKSVDVEVNTFEQVCRLYEKITVQR